MLQSTDRVGGGADPWRSVHSWLPCRPLRQSMPGPYPALPHSTITDGTASPGRYLRIGSVDFFW
jgi:hypothetical protein